MRVESIARVDSGDLRVLDLADPAVRAQVLAFESASITALYESSIAAHFEPVNESRD